MFVHFVDMWEGGSMYVTLQKLHVLRCYLEFQNPV